MKVNDQELKKMIFHSFLISIGICWKVSKAYDQIKQIDHIKTTEE